MAQIITLSDIEAADNTDILQGTRTERRLSAFNFELQADANDASNYFTTSIQNA